MFGLAALSIAAGILVIWIGTALESIGVVWIGTAAVVAGGVLLLVGLGREASAEGGPGKGSVEAPSLRWEVLPEREKRALVIAGMILAVLITAAAFATFGWRNALAAAVFLLGAFLVFVLEETMARVAVAVVGLLLTGVLLDLSDPVRDMCEERYPIENYGFTNLEQRTIDIRGCVRANR